LEAASPTPLRLIPLGGLGEFGLNAMVLEWDDHVLLLDAADMGARPGTVAIVKAGEVQASLLSTHALPLSVVMEFLAKDTKAAVTLVGIQPNTAHHGETPCSQEQAGLTRLLVSTFHILGQGSGRGTRALARESRAL